MRVVELGGGEVDGFEAGEVGAGEDFREGGGGDEGGESEEDEGEGG